MEVNVLWESSALTHQHNIRKYHNHHHHQMVYAVRSDALYKSTIFIIYVLLALCYVKYACATAKLVLFINLFSHRWCCCYYYLCHATASGLIDRLLVLWFTQNVSMLHICSQKICFSFQASTVHTAGATQYCKRITGFHISYCTALMKLRFDFSNIAQMHHKFKLES